MRSQAMKSGMGRVMLIVVAAIVMLVGTRALMRMEAQAPIPPANVNRLSVLFLGDEAGHRPFERAKGLLQSRNGLTEEEAYLHLRGESRRLRKPMRNLAEGVILAEELHRKTWRAPDYPVKLKVEEETWPD